MDEKIAAQQVKANVFGLEKLRDYLHQGFLCSRGRLFRTRPVELHADRARCRALQARSQYRRRGHVPEIASISRWPVAYVAADMRPPICSDYIGQTARAMRALQLYAPKTDQAAYDQSIHLAAAWIAEGRTPATMRIASRACSAWPGPQAIRTPLRKPCANCWSTQRSDGGWSDLDSMQSTAYRHRKSLFALQTASVAASDPAYQRAVQYLLNTQQEDGSWYVKSRALALQPYFDAGFPHGFDQWISAAGTSWATMALSSAAPQRSAAR